jgi:hypothetical protein
MTRTAHFHCREQVLSLRLQYLHPSVAVRAVQFGLRSLGDVAVVRQMVVPDQFADVR